MDDFILDKRLQNDCFLLKETEQSLILLMNNQLIPWFILVPKTDQTEFYQLEPSLQQYCFKQINKISKYIQSNYGPDKLNVAMIGNIVSQLHIHIIGRYLTDPYWPGVVWGCEVKQSYTLSEYENFAQQFKATF